MYGRRKRDIGDWHDPGALGRPTESEYYDSKSHSWIGTNKRPPAFVPLDYRRDGFHTVVLADGSVKLTTIWIDDKGTKWAYAYTVPPENIGELDRWFATGRTTLSPQNGSSESGGESGEGAQTPGDGSSGGTLSTDGRTPTYREWLYTQGKRYENFALDQAQTLVQSAKRSALETVDTIGNDTVNFIESLGKQFNGRVDQIEPYTYNLFKKIPGISGKQAAQWAKDVGTIIKNQYYGYVTLSGQKIVIRGADTLRDVVHKAAKEAQQAVFNAKIKTGNYAKNPAMPAHVRGFAKGPFPSAKAGRASRPSIVRSYGSYRGPYRPYPYRKGRRGGRRAYSRFS